MDPLWWPLSVRSSQWLLWLQPSSCSAAPAREHPVKYSSYVVVAVATKGIWAGAVGTDRHYCIA